ncbi:unnamed protein product [Dibothriocephalus latus]|uniref:Uncharacterized protein n=1 Tax=Dibothriocephalus latus TaxID=60516 RepID=A0A3P7QJ98_DIBLA|nr:unnamed protein product [Dibothriocephalus latus]
MCVLPLLLQFYLIFVAQASHYYEPTLLTVEDIILQALHQRQIVCDDVHEFSFCLRPATKGFNYTDGCTNCSCLGEDRVQEMPKLEKPELEKPGLEKPELKKPKWEELEEPNVEMSELANATDIVTLGHMPEHMSYTEHSVGLKAPEDMEKCVGKYEECRKPKNDYEESLCEQLAMIQYEHFLNYLKNFQEKSELY